MLERRRRREYYRELHEDQLLDIAYRGYTKEQEQQDLQLQIQLDWLSRQQ